MEDHEISVFESLVGSVREFILDVFLKGEPPEDLTNQTHLVDTGVVDSINVLKIVEFIEDEFDVELEPTDIEKMISVVAIAEVIQEKVDA